MDSTFPQARQEDELDLRGRARGVLAGGFGDVDGKGSLASLGANQRALPKEVSRKFLQRIPS